MDANRDSMLTEHQVKTWPQFFQAAWDRKKTAELRRNDRDYEVADTLVMREYDPASGRYTGRRIAAEITHVCRELQFGLTEGFAMLSLGNLENFTDTEPTHATD